MRVRACARMQVLARVCMCEGPHPHLRYGTGQMRRDIHVHELGLANAVNHLPRAGCFEIRTPSSPAQDRRLRPAGIAHCLRAAVLVPFALPRRRYLV